MLDQYINSNATQLEEAKERWIQKSKPFAAVFKEGNPFTVFINLFIYLFNSYLIIIIYCLRRY